MFNKITLFAVCCLIFTSCIFNERKSLQIQFSADSTKIYFSGLSEVNLYRLKTQLQKDSGASGLVNVVEVDSESSYKDKIIAGKLYILNKDVVFNPDTPLVRGKTYFVRTLLHASFGKTSDILKSDLGHNIKWHQKTLKR